MPVGFLLSICRNRTTNCQSFGNRGYWSDNNGTLAINLTEVTLTGMIRDVCEHSSKGLALIVETIGIADEIEEHLLLFEHDFLNAQLFAKYAEGNHIDEFFSYIGDGAKAVDEAFAIGLKIIFEMVAVGKVVEFAVEQHTFGVTGDVLIGEVHLYVGLEGTIVNPLTIEH